MTNLNLKQIDMALQGGMRLLTVRCGCNTRSLNKAFRFPLTNYSPKLPQLKVLFYTAGKLFFLESEPCLLIPTVYAICSHCSSVDLGNILNETMNEIHDRQTRLLTDLKQPWLNDVLIREVAAAIQGADSPRVNC